MRISDWSSDVCSSDLEPAEFARLLIAVKNGTPVRLSDVAKVYGGQQDEYQAAWFNDARTVGLQISKRPEANAVATVEAIRARLPQLRASLPSNVTIDRKSTRLNSSH